jgi:hypothetical protein
MKILATATALAVGLVLTGCGGSDMSASAPASTAAPAPSAEQPAAPATAEPMTTAEDSLLAEPTWAVLFAGHDLTSFNTVGGGNWKLADGYVSADAGEPGWLVTKGAFANFEIRVEFQASSETNSGVFIRCEDPNDISAERCYEINIFDHNQNPNNLTGAIVNVAPPATSVMAGDQWNTLDITAVGSHLTVRFNDTVTVDVEDQKHAAGYIGLQYNAGPIKFRDVRWRPL